MDRKSSIKLLIVSQSVNKHDRQRQSSFGSFGQAVSEEKIKKNDPSETRIAYGGHNFTGLRQIEQSIWRNETWQTAWIESPL
jgi:hypothetical protein